MTAQQQPHNPPVESAPAGSCAEAFDWNAELATLRALDAARKEPLRLHYLEALAARATSQPAPVQRLLQAKWEQSVQELHARLAQAQSSLAQDTTAMLRVEPAASPLRSLLDQLSQTLAEPESDSAESCRNASAQARPELRSVRKFRKTWSRLSTDKQLRQAMVQAPKNAGPINSHMLVLRSLQLMQDISPDYLNRFMSYADALLYLDQYERPVPTPSKPRRARPGT